jgi:tetratricopeptide (TPR) repeat protein
MELESVGAAAAAERLCRRALQVAPAHGPGHALLARALERLQLDSLAERVVAAAASGQGGIRADAALLAHASARAERRGQPGPAAELLRLAQRAEATPARAQKLAELELRAGRDDLALAALAEAAATWPFARGPRVVLARHQEAAGDTEAAARTWGDWLTVCPEDDGALVELARVRALRGELEPQRELLRQALELNPNLKDQRRQLEFLESDSKPFHAPFEVDADAVIAADPGPPADAAAHNDPLHYLLHQRVVVAYRGGTSSEYHHTIQRVLNEEGARRRSSFRVRYWSGEQRARLLSARVVRKDGQVLRPRLQGAYVELPQLAAGDVLDLRWRVDDLAPTFFGDVFGLEHGFVPADGAPARRSELVLVLEPGREYRFQAANGAPDGERVTEPDGRIVCRYALPEVSRAVVEERRPSRRENEPLVRVTTYRDWDHFGSWWWHLIRDQIEVSPAMRSKVSELTAGLATEREKIAAIFEFVTTEVRYTAWEFGVHGYKPYSTPVIFERRHGDCKDKALLLQAMLGEIGVKAHPVIIHADELRSHDDLSLPMVGHFNHCISFLPAQGDRPAMFLDGTAVYHDRDTVPEMDQGARVLVVQGERSELREVPWAAAGENRDERELSIDVQATGDATIDVVHRPLRNLAVPVREELGNEPAKRREKLEQALGRWFGKVEVESVETSDLLDLAAPVAVRARLRSRGFAARQDGALWLKGAFEPSPLAPLARAGQRELPLLLGPPRSEVRRVRYRLPAGHVAQPLPEPIAVDARFGAFTTRWSQDGDELVVERALVLKVPRIEATEYPAFREFAQAVEQAERQRVAVRPQENGR